MTRFPVGCREDGGFTLIEVMIATAILGFVILGIGSLAAFTSRTTNFARRTTEAAGIARNAMESARNTAYANVVSETVCYRNWKVGDTLPSNAANNAIDREKLSAHMLHAENCAAAGILYRQEVTVATDVPIGGMKEIRVLVTWQDETGRQRRVDLASSISGY